VLHLPRLAARGREVGEAHEVEHERSGEGRVAALPGELQAHARPEEALEVHEVPGRLPVVQRGHEVDPDLGMEARVAQDRAQGLVLVAPLGLAAHGVGERLPSLLPSML
jgi:hypothetical protein